jgi:hypothetical protein
MTRSDLWFWVRFYPAYALAMWICPWVPRRLKRYPVQWANGLLHWGWQRRRTP